MQTPAAFLNKKKCSVSQLHIAEYNQEMVGTLRGGLLLFLHYPAGDAAIQSRYIHYIDGVQKRGANVPFMSAFKKMDGPFCYC